MVVDRAGNEFMACVAVLGCPAEGRSEHLAAGDTAMELKRRGDGSVHADGIAVGRAADDPGDEGGRSEFDVR
jgi:hypothetical protein